MSSSANPDTGDERLFVANEIAEHYSSALSEGQMVYQRCNRCGHSWLPPSSHCSTCLSDNWSWVGASGRAKLVSWVVYHRAYSDEVADQIPYAVGIVELVEGPRLIARIHGPADLESFSVGERLTMKIVQIGSKYAAAFEATSGD